MLCFKSLKLNRLIILIYFQTSSKEFLTEILSKESASNSIQKSQLDLIISESNGDMRRAVNMLQNLVSVLGNVKTLSDANISNFLGVVLFRKLFFNFDFLIACHYKRKSPQFIFIVNNCKKTIAHLFAVFFMR